MHEFICYIKIRYLNFVKMNKICTFVKTKFNVKQL